MKPESATFEDRAAGALAGAFIGEALGVGPHWYYDLDAMRAAYGSWIAGYTDPQPDRYHAGLRAGMLSQAGIILEMTARSLVECGRYDQDDFCRRLDGQLFPQLNGGPYAGPGGYTSQSIREAWRRRVVERQPWGRTAGLADTTEAIERTLAIAIRYARNPRELADAVSRNTALTQGDPTVLAITVAFNAVLGLLVQGHRLDPAISDILMNLASAGDLPFHRVTGAGLQAPDPGAPPEPPRAGQFASPDALLTPGAIAQAASDPDIRIEPAWKAAFVYGLPCAVYHQVPAAYYLAARFHDDFESAVLHALNGGGQNQARAMLTGALAGAQTGLSGIPERFVAGLDRSADFVGLARQLAAQAAGDSPES